MKPQVKSEGTTEDTSTVPPANPAQSLDTIDSKLAPSSHGSQGGLTPPLASVDSFTEPQFETFGDGESEWWKHFIFIYLENKKIR